MTKEEFLTRATEKHGYKYTYLNLNDKILSHDVIEMFYKGLIYKQTVVKHILLGRCPEKNTLTRSKEDFIKKSIEVWGDKYDYSLVDYKNSGTKVKIIFENIIFEQNPQSHLLGMAPELNMNQEYFIKKSYDKWGDKYDYSLVNYINCKKKVKIIYKKTGEIFEQSPSGHLNGAPENIRFSVRKTTEQFIKEGSLIHDNKYSYDKTIYVTSIIKVIITCPIHGDFTQNPLSHVQGNGCPNCNESRGEKAIAKYLDKNNISYYRQHRFNDCKNVFELPFDFYIPALRTAIEFDGKQHYEPMEYFGGLQTFEKLQINDRIKSDYCEDNYIDLVRVKYTQLDNIEDYLKEVFKFKK